MLAEGNRGQPKGEVVKQRSVGLSQPLLETTSELSQGTVGKNLKTSFSFSASPHCRQGNSGEGSIPEEPDPRECPSLIAQAGLQSCATKVSPGHARGWSSQGLG